MIIDPGLALSIVVMTLVLVVQHKLTSSLATTAIWVLLLLVGRSVLDGYSTPLLHTLAIAAPIVWLAMWSLSRLQTSKGYWFVLPVVAALLVLFGTMTLNIDLDFD